MPVWQSLHASLQERNFTVVTVAMDEPEAARPWIELAKPTYPCLIDRNHHVAELYNMVNVPQATWIDEAGTYRAAAGERRLVGCVPTDGPHDHANVARANRRA